MITGDFLKNKMYIGYSRAVELLILFLLLLNRIYSI